MKTLMTGTFVALLAVSGTSYARGGGSFHMSSRSYSTPRFSVPSTRSYTPRTSSLSGEHYTSGYTRQNGTPVHSYHATNPNATKFDNWSTKGHINPYTGQAGTKSPY